MSEKLKTWLILGINLALMLAFMVTGFFMLLLAIPLVFVGSLLLWWKLHRPPHDVEIRRSVQVIEADYTIISPEEAADHAAPEKK